MERLILLFVLQLCIATYGSAQVFPKGMNYQAVARDSKGGLIEEQMVDLKITLFANTNQNRKNYYSEDHKVKTNIAGLFDLVIGEGGATQGNYGLVPWNEENIWLEVAIVTNSRSDFSILSQSKLMAVPYAIHALTANQVEIQNEKDKPDFALNAPGVVSSKWSIFGNANTNNSGNLYHTNALGTTDKVDLIMITDNVERLRILSGGDIVTKLNFEIGKDLNVLGNANVQQKLTIGDSLIVKKNVLLNTLGGTTLVYGPFTVSNGSPTLLSGKLTVDSSTLLQSTLDVHGPTDLNNRLYVNNMSPTHLTGTLQVDKTADLEDSLNVNNMSPTHLTGTLDVDKSVNLNDSFSILQMAPALLTGTLIVEKATTFNDTLSVNNMSPTAFSGTLTVEKESKFLKQVLMSDTTQSTATDNGALVIHGGFGVGRNFNVGGNTKFGGPVGFASPVLVTDATQSVDTVTGAVVVSGGVGIQKNLSVGGMATIEGMTLLSDTSQSYGPFTGALKVLGGTGIAQNLNVGGNTTLTGMTTISSPMQSTSVNSGALKVAGAVGIGLRLNVGGMTSLLDATQSISPESGALQVVGGVGIGKQLTIGGMTSIIDLTQSSAINSGALKVTGGVGIAKNIIVGGMTSILDPTNSVNSSTGALKVSGGVGIPLNLNVGGTLTASGTIAFEDSLILQNNLTVNSTNSAAQIYVATFENTTGPNGISIEINNNNPGHSNNFMEFRNASSQVIGRIEGETSTELLTNPVYKYDLSKMDLRVTNADIALAVASLTSVLAGIWLTRAVTSTTGCVGFPVNCATIPIPSLIAAATVTLAAGLVDLAANIVGTVQASNRRNDFINYKANRVGVTYESGTGDYAEWLPKADPEEVLLPGNIVSLKYGKISKKIYPDSKLMVISTKPIVLGNTPDETSKTNFEKVAFLGQVPVHIVGKVHAGDYILPSGLNDGLGIAIDPSQLQVEDYPRIVGVSWTASEDEGYKLINVAVGLNGNAINRFVVDQKNKIALLKQKIEKRNAILATMVSGYGESTSPDPIAGKQSLIATNRTKAFLTENKLDVSKEFISDLLSKAEKLSTTYNNNAEAEKFWTLLKSDSNYRDQFIGNIQEEIQKEFPKQLELLKSKLNDYKD